MDEPGRGIAEGAPSAPEAPSGALTWREGESGAIVAGFPVEWGDCDEAGIVFYPHYFRWFDAAFQRLLRSRALSQGALRARFGVVGTPILEAGASFRSPARSDDVLEIVARIESWGRTTFRVAFDGRVREHPVVAGHEIRAFVAQDEAGRLRAVPPPDAFRALFP